MYLNKCLIVELLDKPGLVQITGSCQRCGEPWFLVSTKKNIDRVAAGEAIEKVFPNMLMKTRVLLVEGLCDVCKKVQTTDGI